MSHKAKDTLELRRALDLPISTCHNRDGTVELFVHTDPKSLDKSLPPLIRALYQALEFAKHHARRRRGGDTGGGTRKRPKNPVLTS